MCPPFLIPVDYGLLSVPAGLHANMPFFVDMVVRSTSVSTHGGTPLQFKQGWIDQFAEQEREHCRISPYYPSGIFGNMYDPDHLPGCPDYVAYPLPPHVYSHELSWNPVTKKFDSVPL